MGSLLLWVLVFLFCAWAGAKIGEPKGRRTQGAWIGLLLGIVGLVIVYFLPTRPEVKFSHVKRREPLPPEDTVEGLTEMYRRDLISESEYVRRSEMLRRNPSDPA